jgi:hypothetical protein
MITDNDPILALEKALHAFWQDYGRTDVKKGVNAEIKIEPKFFLNGKLNPEVEDLILSVYLSHLGKEDIKNGRISLEKGEIKLKDRMGNLIAIVRSPSMVEETVSRLGL